MSMTPRERWLALFDGRKPDRIPTDIWATDEVYEQLRQDLNCADNQAVWDKLGIDTPVNLIPWYKGPKLPDNTDFWGVRSKMVDYGTGAYSETDHCPLADATCVDDIHAHPWPNPDDFDYQRIVPLIEQNDGYRPLRGGGFEPFLLYCKLRGLEKAFEDLLIDTDIAEAGLQHIFDFFYELNRRTFEAAGGKIDLFYLAEDLGAQTGPLFSLDVYRKFIMPNQKRMADLAKQHGAHVFYHTDGSAKVFLPDLIDHVGIEILNPIQWRCPTMERETLAAEFGDKVIFHGAIDNQQTLPFGTPEDVRAEVIETAEIFKECRWICAPCHNLQPNTPTENIVAMYEAVSSLTR